MVRGYGRADAGGSAHPRRTVDGRKSGGLATNARGGSGCRSAQRRGLERRPTEAAGGAARPAAGTPAAGWLRVAVGVVTPYGSRPDRRDHIRVVLRARWAGDVTTRCAGQMCVPVSATGPDCQLTSTKRDERRALRARHRGVWKEDEFVPTGWFPRSRSRLDALGETRVIREMFEPVGRVRRRLAHVAARHETQGLSSPGSESSAAMARHGQRYASRYATR